MKYLILIFTVITTSVYCSQINEIRDFIKHFNYSDDETDKLKQETQELIDNTRIEFLYLENLIETNIRQSMDQIDSNISRILNSSVTRTNELATYLIKEISDSQTNPIDYSSCLITLPFIQSLAQSFSLRAQLSLVTSARLTNTTIRQSVLTMSRTILSLTTLSNELNGCQDASCVLEISIQVERNANEFLVSNNLINSNIQALPPILIANATSAAAQTLYEDEEYACSNAELVKTCIKSFNDDVVNDVTTIGPSTLTTPPYTTTSTPPYTTTISDSTSESPTTVAPKVYCNHEPFVPDYY